MLALLPATAPSDAFASRQDAGLSPPSDALPLQEELSLCDDDTLDVDLTGPADGTWQPSTVEVEWTTSGSALVTDAGVHILRLGDGWTAVAQGVEDDGRFPVDDLPDGEYWVYVWVRDEITGCYAEAWNEVSFRIDSTPPAVDVRSPTGAVGDEATIEWCSGEDHPDTVEIAHRADSASGWTTIAEGVADGEGCPGYDWSTRTVADGRYRVRVTATDRAGNVDEGVSERFTIDNSDPAATIARPVHGSHHEEGIAGITGEASDDGSGVGSTSLRLRRADGLYLDRATGSWLPFALANPIAGEGAWHLDLPPLDPGGYRATLVVRDRAGNVDEATAAFTVGDGAPGNGSDPGDPPDDGPPTVGPEDVTDLGDGRFAFDFLVGHETVRRVRGVVDGSAVGLEVAVDDLDPSSLDPPGAERVCAAFDLELVRDGAPVEAGATITVVSPRCEQAGERAILYHLGDAGWEGSPADPVGDDGDRTVYQASVDGLSPFALGAEAIASGGPSAVGEIALLVGIGAVMAASIVAMSTTLSRRRDR